MDSSSARVLQLQHLLAAQKLVTHVEQGRAHTLETTQVGIDRTQLVGEFGHFQTLLYPSGEIAFFVLEPMSGFENVKIDGTHFYLAQCVPKFLQRCNLHSGRYLDNAGLIEIKGLAK